MFGVRSRGAAVLAVALALLLPGCVGGDPKPTSTPKPTATPLFSSDAEALAAANESYQRYLDVFNQVANAGWVDMSPLSDVESGSALEGDREAGSLYKSKNWKLEGTATFDRMKVQYVGRLTLTAYVCLDLTKADVVDASGVPQRNSDYTPRVPLVLSFEGRDPTVLSKSSRWSGDDFC